MDTPVPAKKSNLLPGTACEFLATRLFVWLLQTSQRYRQETPVLRLSKLHSFFLEISAMQHWTTGVSWDLWSNLMANET